MQKQSKKRIRKLRNLIVVFSLTAVVLSVSTYAWFIGMKTVNVSTFEVEIAATDSLLLSLDGDAWDSTVTINKGNLDEVSYTNHTNSWGGKGLIPLSSIGKIDSTASRLTLYEKASLTPTPGGYRLLASRVANTGEKEKDGYVAFDLFIKNLTGSKYIVEENIKDEEAIYLTTDSEVLVGSTGVANTGIENSVRVAFAQIGRVKGDSAQADVVSIKCTPEEDSPVTGLCVKRDAQIWEPNDKNHEANAISWYDTSCLGRVTPEGETLNDVTLASSYSGKCESIEHGTAYPTYAIKEEIKEGDNVDIYDGKAYNKFEKATKLYEFPYFTDTMKLKTGTDRPEFMYLAPNSITKVRVYVYIEGQDIDNYDFASIGKTISVKFGFTKERFNEEDIDYDGPELPMTDVTRPVITLTGDNTITLLKDGEYEELGATALDNKDGNLTSSIVIDATEVDTSKVGRYDVTYNVTDSAGNKAFEVVRRVIVTEEIGD